MRTHRVTLRAERVEAVTTVASPSLKGSSEFDDAPVAEFDFTGLQDATKEVPTVDGVTTPDLTGNEKICPQCNEAIIGARGRQKYHPECRPSAAKRATDSIAGVGTTVKGSNGRAAKEADEIVIMIRKRLVQGVFFVMVADQYDGFVLMSAIPGICENIRGVLITHDGWRKELLRMKEGGSIIGLAFSLIMPIAAICAHHGLIPFARVSDMLVNLPKVMFRIQQRMAEGEKATEDMMKRIGEEFLRRDGEGAQPNDSRPNNVHTAFPGQQQTAA
jgi:hypothetical protein